MYKLLLCLRYLRTRYIALASIFSVMLGVATMIVVNSVMAGFANEIQSRLHNILSDIVIEWRGLEGMTDPDRRMADVRKVAGDDIESMAAIVAVPAMLSYQFGGNGNWVTQQVQLVGIDPEQGQASNCAEFLQHPENRRHLTFDLHLNGYDIHDHQSPDGPEREQMRQAGWGHRTEVARYRKELALRRQIEKPPAPSGPVNPFDRGRKPQDEKQFDMAKEQYSGAILGIAMASFRTPKGEDRFRVLPGDDVKLTFPTAGTPPQAVSDNFTVVDFYESKMSEYDERLIFVPLRKLQELRGMIDNNNVGLATQIQIKLRPGADGNAVRDKLRAATSVFPPEFFGIYTWCDKQGALLAAVQVEISILNVLLFLIIAVAGFGILAIFYMIVVEKTRDIGILKSLGAPGRGVMGIFLAYGLSLGLVGAGAGLVIGLLFVRYINPINDFLSWVSGRPLFNPEIYYFYKIPTIVRPETIAWIVIGALAIAVTASILPARRAARLHPVEALRYE